MEEKEYKIKDLEKILNKTFACIMSSFKYFDIYTYKNNRFVSVKLTDEQLKKLTKYLSLSKQEKIKLFNLKKYGCENVFQSEKIKNKIKETCKKKYGCEYAQQSITTKEHRKETNLKKYGVEHNSQISSVKESKVEHAKQKYGVDNVSKSEEIKEKKKETTKKHYGVEYALSSKEIREKIKKTSLEKYGTDNPAKSDIIKDRCKQTMIEKYGKPYFSQTKIWKEKVGLNSNSVKYNYDNCRFDSSWEFIFYLYFKDRKIDIIRNKDEYFEYKIKGITHRYYPDFKINNKFYEIKGEQFIIRTKSGKVKNLKNPYEKGKIYNEKYKCLRKNKVVLITINEMDEYFNYFYSKYNDDFLKEFKIRK